MRYDKAEFKAAYGTFGQLPDSDLPEIAFAGRSNVGLNIKNTCLPPSGGGKLICHHLKPLLIP